MYLVNSGTEILLPDNAFLTDVEEFSSESLKFGCRKGACGICLVKISTSKENISAPTTREKSLLLRMGRVEEDLRLACQVKVFGDIAIEYVE
ncbi:2Fe-2S iron-sulfur cluster binding domain-containing protein [Vibrio lentus]